MSHIYETKEEAESASNELYLELYPSGTTELLYGWIITDDGKYRLLVPQDVSLVS